MPEIIEVINRLKMFSIFDGLGTREIHAVASIAQPTTMKKGDIVLRAGEENPSIYLVVTGQVITYQMYETPEQKELRVVDANDHLNFVPMFTALPPVNTSVVTQDAELFVVCQSQFHEIMRIYPQIGLNLLKQAALIFRKMGISA